MDIAVKEYLKEFLKCRNDPKYFIKKYVKVPVTGGLVPFLNEPKYFELIDAVFTKHRVIVLGSRQVGKTTTMLAICAYLLNFFQNYKIAHISRTEDQAKQDNADLQTILEALPSTLFVGFKKKSATMTELKNGSAFIVEAARVEKSKNDKGRGLRSPFIWIDEAAFVDLNYLMGAIIPVVSRQAEIAKKQHLPWGIVLTSTPNGTTGIGAKFYQLWQTAKSSPDIAGYWPVLMHWKDISFCTEEWYKERCKDLNYDWAAIDREYNLHFTAGENTLFERKVLEMIKPIDPINVIKVPYVGEIKIFSDINLQKRYLIGIDIATGYSNDNSAIEAIDFDTEEQVLEFISRCSIDDLKRVIDIIMALLPNSIIAVETNSYGDEILRYVTEKYQRKVYFEPIFRGKDIEKIEFGITTTRKTKPLIIEALYNAVNEQPSIIKSQVLFNELASLRRTDTGDEFKTVTKDDAVMAIGFTYYIRRFKYQNIIKQFNMLMQYNTNTEFIKTNENDLLTQVASWNQDLSISNNSYNPFFEQTNSNMIPFFKKW